MFSRRLNIIAACALALGLTHAARAQEASGQLLAASAPDNYVTHTSFKNRIFEVKHRDPNGLVSVIKLLTSGHKGAQVSANNDYNTITVRDFPENIVAIEEALRRLDTPEAPRPEVELRMHVLLASNVAGGANQVPAGLKDVVNQLEPTLSFKHYQLLTSIIQRTKERITTDPTYIRSEGSVLVPGATAPLNYHYNLQAGSLKLRLDLSGSMSVQLDGFQFVIDGQGERGIVRSDVSVRDGERIVVGTTSLQDKSLVLVLTAKLLK